MTPENEEVMAENGRIAQRERRSGWLLGLAAFTMAMLIAFGMIYINSRVAASERRDCDTLRADIEAIESVGELTLSGARVTEARRMRYREIGCRPVLPAASYRIVKAPR